MNKFTRQNESLKAILNKLYTIYYIYIYIGTSYIKFKSFSIYLFLYDTVLGGIRYNNMYSNLTT